MKAITNTESLNVYVCMYQFKPLCCLIFFYLVQVEEHSVLPILPRNFWSYRWGREHWPGSGSLHIMYVYVCVCMLYLCVCVCTGYSSL